MKKLLIGTNNPSKLELFRSYFDPAKIECISPAELGLSISPAEDARTAEGNALQKALSFHQATGLPVFTEDSGLVYLDLPKDHPDQPGVHVRRPANHLPLTDDEDMLRYYAEVIRRHNGRLRAAWQDAWCFLGDENHYSIFADSDEALSRHAMILVDVPCAARCPGWPLDSLTVSSATGRYWAEMTLEEKQLARQQEFADLEVDRQKMLAWLERSIEEIL